MNPQLLENNNGVDTLEKGIVETRNRMTDTLDRLADKADPGDLIDSLYQWGRRKIESLDSHNSGDSLRNAAHEAGRFVKENPVPVALGLATIGSTFFTHQRDHSEARGGLSQFQEEASEKVTELKNSTTEKAETLKQQVTEKTEELRDAVDEPIEKASSQISEITHKASEKAGELAETVTNQLKSAKDENPLPLCAGLLVSGFVLGLLVPKSRREEKLYGAAADRAKTKLVEKGRAIADEAKAKLSENRLDRQGLTGRAKDAVNEYEERLQTHLHQS